jgi:hypothetical protein
MTNLDSFSKGDPTVETTTLNGTPSLWIFGNPDNLGA